MKRARLQEKPREELLDQPQERGDWTYGDMLTWLEDERWEIIDGEAFAMAPTPGTPHQQVSRELCFLIRSFLEGKPCQLFNAPYSVFLPVADEAEKDVRTVVEPDIIVVCDPEKIVERGCRGAPDWVIEILSPSSSGMDHIRKRDLYERHGVKEYRVVQPDERSVWVCHLVGKRFSRRVEHGEKARITVRTLPELEIDMAKVLPPRPVSLREPPRRYG